MKPIRTYTLFHGPRGWTPMTVHYDGTEYTIAAVSIKQAYYFAGHREWADPDSDRPLGILQVYRRDRDCTYEMCCGCENHVGFRLGHDNKQKRIVERLYDHRTFDCEEAA